MSKNTKLWGGRFRSPLAKSAEAFSASIGYDARLYPQDIMQSIAYAKTLKKAGILAEAETKKIIRGLEEIKRGLDSGRLHFRSEFEDVHMNIEAWLIEKVGEVGKKLHTGRSRNDQVATDLRMYLKWEITETIVLITRLQAAIIDQAEQNISVIMPGYTHLQRAQPVLLAHHLLAYFEMLQRDRERFNQTHERVDVMPLGSGALSGTNFPLDRAYLAKELGFYRISANSMDAVSDRDFVIDYLSAAAVLMMHLSRLADEIIIWSSYEFGFVQISDSFSTGSSLMPQKKNPDVAELVRGKSGRVFGHLVSLLTLMKGLPLTYNRDLQEDKEQLFGSIDTVKSSLSIFSEMIKTIKFNQEVMGKAVKKGYLTATDVVYYLVVQGVPFREAHEIVGKIVNYCEESNMELDYISLNQLKQFSSKFSYDVQRILSAKASVEAKDTIGGTSPKRVKEALKRARAHLLHDKA
ncbi:argininosuccinate lyase [Candidatus Saganbacteria bacterium]|nr:argininosuccinate lyase [Candidatus Saganbacteria bacterium]